MTVYKKERERERGGGGGWGQKKYSEWVTGTQRSDICQIQWTSSGGRDGITDTNECEMIRIKHTRTAGTSTESEGRKNNGKDCRQLLPKEKTSLSDGALSKGKLNGLFFPFFSLYLFNPLSARPSFQLWYPGGQRLKVSSFSWSGVKSPSKCFSNTEPTTIIASRDEKRCNAPVQWTRLVHSSSLRLIAQWSTPEMSRMTAFLRCPRTAARPSCNCTSGSTSTKTAKCETVAASGLGNRLLKTC